MPPTNLSSWPPASGSPTWLAPALPAPATPRAWSSDAWQGALRATSRLDGSPAGPDALANLKALGLQLWARCRAWWAQLVAQA